MTCKKMFDFEWDLWLVSFSDGAGCERGEIVLLLVNAPPGVSIVLPAVLDMQCLGYWVFSDVVLK